ncbi:MAG: hypothetical protein HYX89_06200 [Chloroflexi bacterium]|nr:hypothetical protein [Chloroflexota bacterium]
MFTRRKTTRAAEDRGIVEFREAYRDEMLRKEGISEVVYFGPTKGPYWEGGKLKKWEGGRSDLDIEVYGHSIIAVKVKVEGALLIEKLNYELGLRLEDVPLEHWTPFYMDNSPGPAPFPPVPRRLIDQLAKEEMGKRFSEFIRSHNKEIVKRFGPLLTHKDLWRLVKAEQALPFPMLCQILL